ncbi:P-loop containing nucleoside triphosphate hydrolase protein [Emericellopsis atlantica]|uniref:P-loop containing nucleoside triphosphate hydrolase protein n=1 Tax=Emericellopsis atlantica TaxID=2614577 RepID=A0A9P8CRH3_9HYPO|nr:P-loop containing nucleoside triphosphate hydrolase protein [Emericellopsis atlantica]KAG9256170.1 P-loop containing nucleoside triphosphate hydrolase protein [Emericellopsis atlantica]
MAHSRENSSSIESWRHLVPSEDERTDPFSELESLRPATRLTHHRDFSSGDHEHSHHATIASLHQDASSIQSRPPSRISSTIRRVVTPVFGKSAVKRAATVLGTIREHGEHGTRKRDVLRGLLRGNKRKRSESPDEEVLSGQFTKGLSLAQDGQRRRINVLFVGGKTVGQTSLLFRARYGYFPDANAITRTCYEVYAADRAYNDRPVTLEIYMAWDAVVLCFDVADKIGLYSIVSWWRCAVNEGFTSSSRYPPLLHLVGMKCDKRSVEEGLFDTGPANLAAFPTCCVEVEEATWQARRIGADRYLECSALTGEGVKSVVDELGREVVRRDSERDETNGLVVKKKRRL